MHNCIICRCASKKHAGSIIKDNFFSRSPFTLVGCHITPPMHVCKSSLWYTYVVASFNIHVHVHVLGYLNNIRRQLLLIYPRSKNSEREKESIPLPCCVNGSNNKELQYLLQCILRSLVDTGRCPIFNYHSWASN